MDVIPKVQFLSQLAIGYWLIREQEKVSLRVTMPGRISRKDILGLRGIYTWTLGDVAPPQTGNGAEGSHPTSSLRNHPSNVSTKWLLTNVTGEYLLLYMYICNRFN